MKKGLFKRILSFALSVLMVMSMLVMTTAAVSAATDSGVLKLTVADVTKKYSVAGNLLNTLNALRTKNGLSEVKMDKDLYNAATARAAELPILFANTSLTDEYYNDKWSTDDLYAENYYREIVLAVDSEDQLENQLTQYPEVLDEEPDEVGIGAVSMNTDASGNNQILFVCIRLTNEKTKIGKKITTVAKTEYAKADVTGNVTVRAYNHNVNLTTPYDNGDYTLPMDETVQLYFIAASSAGCLVKVIPYSLTSSNWDVVNVASGGKVIGKSAGSSRITMKLNGENDYTYSEVVTLNVAADVSNCTIDPIPDQTYTGKDICPAVTIRDGSKVLTAGTDYTLRYSDNLHPGQASVTAIGTGNYAGLLLSASFNIVKTAEDFTMEVSTSSSQFILGGAAELMISTYPEEAADHYHAAYTLNGQTVDMGNSDNRVIGFCPDQPGTYVVTLTASNEKYSHSKTITIEVASELSVTLAASKTEAVVGEKLTLTATKAGGLGSCQYSFYSSDQSLSVNTDKNTTTFIPRSSGRVTVDVYVTDETGGSDTAQVTITCYAPLVLEMYVDYSGSETPDYPFVGQPVNVNVSQMDGGKNPVVKGSYTVNGKKTTVNSSANGFTFTPATTGEYLIEVEATDSLGQTVKKSETITVYDVLKNTSVINKTTVYKDKPVVVTGRSTGGVGTVSYQYYYKKSTSAAWTFAGKGASAEISFASVADYKVKAVAMDESGNEVNKTFTVKVIKETALTNNSTLSSQTVPVGTRVTVMGAATGGTAPYTYQYAYKKSTGTAFNVIGSGYTANTTAEITPAMAATYLIRVTVKDSTGAVAAKTMEVTSVKAASLTNESVMRVSSPDGSVYVGDTVHLIGMASGGKGSYAYSFSFKKSTSSAWTALQPDADSAATAGFTPAMKAVYYVRVIVTDTQTKETAAKQFTVDVQKKEASALENTSRITTPCTTTEQAYVGQQVTICASAQGGTGAYSYQYYYKKSTSSTWTRLSPSAASASVASFTPAMKAVYQIKVTAADSSGASADKIFTVTAVTADDSLQNTSTISAEKVVKGDRVVINASAQGGTAPYTAAYYYKKSSSSSWQSLEPSAAADMMAVFVPVSKTSYDLKVVVTDGDGSKAEKLFTVTVS